MIKKLLFMSSCACLLYTNAYALEFKSIGTVGVGGAGVARPPAGLESYWNPAALAFNEGKKAFTFNVQADAKIKGDLADSLERLNQIGAAQSALPAGGSSNPYDSIQGGLTDGVRAVSVMEGMEGGQSITAGGSVAVGQSVGHWGFGYYGIAHSSVYAVPDLVNIIPNDGSGNPVSSQALQFIAGAGSHVGSNSFFSSAQADQITKAFMTNGLSAQQAGNLVSAFDYNLANGSGTKVSPNDATKALVDTANLIASGKGGVIDSNRTAVTGHAVFLNEIPLSYGKLFNLGEYGSLGVGATVKGLFARVYSNTVASYNADINNVYDHLTDYYKDTITWGTDLGIMWKHSGLSVGVVAKNLNSPQLKLYEGGDLALRPQTRAGIDYEILSWLRITADADLSRNAGLSGEGDSQNVGGGIEITPVSYFGLKIGSYKNIAASDKPVLTGGFMVGPSICNLSINGAYGLGETTFKGHKYPSEAQIQSALNVNF